MNLTFKRYIAYTAMVFSSFLFVSNVEATWNPPVYVSPQTLTGIEGVSASQLDVNLANQGVVVFAGDEPDFPSAFFQFIYSAAYTFGSGWSQPERISSDEIIIFPNGQVGRKYLDERAAVVAMNLSGYCVAAWSGQLNTSQGLVFDVIITNIRSSGGTWSSVQIASDISLNLNVNGAFVAVNDTGDAALLWISYNSTTLTYHTMASILPFGGNWTTPVMLDTYTSGDLGLTPRVSIDPNGNVLASWGVGTNNLSYEVHAATYDAVSGMWTTVVLDASPQNGTTSYNAVDANGNGVVTWTKLIDPINVFFQVFSSSFTYGSGFSTPVAVSDPNFSNSDSNVTMDSNGNATATWSNFIIDINNAQIREVYGARKPLNGNWTTQELISTPGITSTLAQGDASRTIDVDDLGNVVTLINSNFELQSIFYSVQSGWQSPQNINGSNIESSNVGLGICGFALAQWFSVQNPRSQVTASDNFAVGI